MQFSVLMSVYSKDNPTHFQMALESVTEQQTLKPNQVVVVFDGPVSKEIEQSVINVVHNNGNIQFDIVRQKENQGLAAALNAGIAECKYEYIARMDADDIAVICNGQIELDYAIETIEKWCDENIMKLNYCKSGILILKRRLSNKEELKRKDNLINKVNVECFINNNSNDNSSNYDAEGFDNSDGNDTNTTNSNISLLYKNIPIFEEYKYLCIELNNKLNPVNHLKNVNIKLLKKNEQIKKDH